MKDGVHSVFAFCLAFVLASVVACSNGDEMRRQLSELQARNQADSLMTNDSLALTLCEYFDSYGTPNEQMLAHYLLGRTYADMGEAPRALDEYQHAASLADTTNLDSLGHHWLCRIYGQMGELLYRHQLPRNASEAYKKAYSHAQQAKEAIVSVISYEQQGKCYYDLNDEDSAAIIIQNTIDMYLALGDTLRANTAKGPISYLLIKNKNYQKGKEFLDDYEYRSLLSLQPSNLPEDWKLLYFYKGFYHQNIGNADSAQYYYYKELQVSDQPNNKGLAYKGLYQLFNDLNYVDSVAKYAILYAEMTNCVYEQSSYSTLINSQQLYDFNYYKNVAQQKTIEANHAKQTIVIIFFSSLFLIFVIVYFFHYQNNRRKMIRQRINTKYATDMILYTKIKSKWIKDLNIKPNAIIFPEENIAKNFVTLRFSNNFLDMIAQAEVIR